LKDQTSNNEPNIGYTNLGYTNFYNHG